MCSYDAIREKNNDTKMKFMKRTPIGPMILKKRIAHGETAAVWSAFFPKKRMAKFVKRIHLKESAVFARVLWRQAGLQFPRYRLNNISSAFVKGIAPYKTDLISDATHCVTSIQSVAFPYDSEGARVIRKGNEYITEVSVGNCLHKYVNPHLPCATFCRNSANWKSSNGLYGNIAMEDAGVSLNECIDKLSLEELQSVVCQVLVALSWAQKLVQFKHHDLHTGNVFVIRKNVQSEWKTPNGVILRLPATSVRAIIADFGLSAATDPTTLTRHCRIDYSFLAVGSKAWGIWEHELMGNEGYDAVVFLRGEQDTSVHSQWLRSVMQLCRNLFPKLRVSKNDRPLVRVPFTPEDLLRCMLQEYAGSFKPQSET